MRTAVLVLAIIGALAGAALSIKWLGDANKNKDTIAFARKMGADLSSLQSVVHGAYVLLAGSVMAIVGGVLAMRRKGKIAAAVLALAVIVPAALTPKTLLATFFIAIAAILATLVKPGQPEAEARLASRARSSA